MTRTWTPATGVNIVTGQTRASQWFQGWDGDGFMSVGAHRLAAEPATLTLGQRLFTFPGGTQPGPG